MKTQEPAKKPERGAVGRSHSLSHKKPHAASDPFLEADLESPALHPDRYNLANISIAAKSSRNNQQNRANGLGSKLPIQAKLAIGQPNDQYEQEADRVAQQVIQQINSPQAVQLNQAEGIQYKLALNENEGKLQRISLTQQELNRGRIAGASELESSIQAMRGKGQLLADSIRHPYEQVFGADFRQVRIHTDAKSDQLNRLIQAKAFTTKQDLFFRQGMYNPLSRDGQVLVAHELMHVVQQNKRLLRSQASDTSGVPFRQTLQSRQDCSQIQRVVMDPNGNQLDSPLIGLNPTQEKRRDDLEKSEDVFVVADQTVYDNHILYDTPGEIKHLKGVKPEDYKSNLTKALKFAQNRAEIAPMKARASIKDGVIVDDNDEFNQLTSSQLPRFPEGFVVYPSQKRKKLKGRRTLAARNTWDMALYQDAPGKPVAFNFRKDDLSFTLPEKDLYQTVFQYSQGKGLATRHMAGLEDSQWPKWNPKHESPRNTTGLTRIGEKRKYNNLPKATLLVQGHGQDFEKTMIWIGDYADDTNIGSKSKKSRVDSDHHPSNFSSENPTYGEHIRNYLLEQAEKKYPGGSIVEITEYHSHRLSLAVPEGMNPPLVPKLKELIICDSAGQPKQQFKFPQFNETKVPGKFEAEDYSAKAALANPKKKFPPKKGARKGGKKKGDNYIKMEDVVKAYEITPMSVENPSYIDANRKTGLNNPSSLLGDAMEVDPILSRSKKVFLFLKEKDFR